MDKKRAQSTPAPRSGAAAGHDLKESSTATEKHGVGKSGTQHAGVGLSASLGTLGQAAKEVIKEGPAGPQNLDKMVYEGHTMEHGE